MAKARKTILVIDDEKDACWLVSHILREEGYSVLTAVCGKEGIKQFEDQIDEIGLVFLDLKLPDMDGLEVCAHIKRETPDLPVVIMTAYGTEEARKKAEISEVFGFMDKPLVLKKILQLTKEVLGEKNAIVPRASRFLDSLRKLRKPKSTFRDKKAKPLAKSKPPLVSIKFAVGVVILLIIGVVFYQQKMSLMRGEEGEVKLTDVREHQILEREALPEALTVEENELFLTGGEVSDLKQSLKYTSKQLEKVRQEIEVFRQEAAEIVEGLEKANQEDLELRQQVAGISRELGVIREERVEIVEGLAKKLEKQIEKQYLTITEKLEGGMVKAGKPGEYAASATELAIDRDYESAFLSASEPTVNPAANTLPPLLSTAVIYISERKYAQAEAELSRYIEQNPTDTLARALIVRVKTLRKIIAGE
ncbi:response regulator [candidate division NPL-UPA2 bacterium]|nr:response regulator [candidate division NPL-UPA2 bacterium]